MDDCRLSVDLKWSAWSADWSIWDDYSPGSWERMEEAWRTGRRLVVETAPKREIRYGRVVFASGGVSWCFEEAWDQVWDLALQIPGFPDWPSHVRDAARERLRTWAVARREGETRIAIAHPLDQGAERYKEVFRELVAGREPDDPRMPFARAALARLARDPAALAAFTRTLETDGTSPCAVRVEGEASSGEFPDLMLAIDHGEEALLARLTEADAELDSFRSALAAEFGGPR